MLRQYLADFVTAQRDALADAWVSVLALPPDTATARDFLALLVEGLRQPWTATHLSPAREHALQSVFPQFYHSSALGELAQILSRDLPQTLTETTGPADVLAIIEHALAVSPDIADAAPLFTERLSYLSQLSWTMNGLRNQDDILLRAIQEAPYLTAAESSAIWLWDADQQAPVMLITSEGPTSLPKLPKPLLEKLREICATACFYSVDAGESDAGWPEMLRGRAVAFLPLMAQEGCLGILSVRHQTSQSFSLDDIFLLSAFGNHVATAITNARHTEQEGHLVNLLQTSIRQVVQATSHHREGQSEFVESLVDVTAGLTRADVIFTYLEIPDATHPIFACSGARNSEWSKALPVWGGMLLAQYRQGTVHESGDVSQLASLPASMTGYLPDVYSLVPIHGEGQVIGILVACNATILAQEQQTFLTTMAALIGTGVESIEKTDNIARMLIQFANINYVSEAIASTFDPQRIMATISLATSQALNVPIVLCGWHAEDGSIQVYPETTIGLPDEIRRSLKLHDHNAVIDKVLKSKMPVTSRTTAHAGPAFPMLANAGIKDWICAPMVVKERARGIILVADIIPREYALRDIALVSTYANQAALAMENTLLYEEIERQLQQRELLYRISRAFTATLDEQKIQQDLLEVACEALQAPVACVCIANVHTGEQYLAKTQGIAVAGPTPLRWEAERGIVGTVYQLRTPVVSENLAADGRDTVLRQLARDHQLRSALVVPLQLHEETLGTLVVITRELRVFSDADQLLLQAIATEAAAAIRNARIHQKARESSDQLREINETNLHNSSLLLALTGSLCETARAADPPENAVTRARIRFITIAAIHECLAEESPDRIDLHALITTLRGGHTGAPFETLAAQLRLAGTHFSLPIYSAALLMLFLTECLNALVEAREGAALPSVTVTFTQLGQGEMFVEIEDDLPNTESYQVRINPVIIHAVRQELRGQLTDTFDGGAHRMRFRFPRPAVR